MSICQLNAEAFSPARAAAPPGRPRGQLVEQIFAEAALAYVNDLYREAARLAIQVSSVEVEASAEFEGVGLAAMDTLD